MGGPTGNGHTTNKAGGAAPSGTIWRRRPRLVIGATAAVLVVVVLAGVLALVLRNANAGPSVAGVWVGDLQSRQPGDRPSDVYFDLKQDGSTITGTGRMCVNRGGLHTAPIAIHGSLKGGALSLTYDFSPAGIPLGTTPVTLTGSAGNPTTLTSPIGVTVHLRKGDSAAFDALCAGLAAPAPTTTR